MRLNGSATYVSRLCLEAETAMKSDIDQNALTTALPAALLRENVRLNLKRLHTTTALPRGVTAAGSAMVWSR
jgi:hypothetical protein